MRAAAKRAGYTLNQNGLFKAGKQIMDLKTERDYFNILKLKYVEPAKR
jgi:DNA polymerase/3'-5' exonuclease PolX